jgi:hypothetical protein
MKLERQIQPSSPHANIRVHIECADLRASLAYDRSLGILAGASQAQHAAASARARRDQPLYRGIGQRVEGLLLVHVFPAGVVDKAMVVASEA